MKKRNIFYGKQTIIIFIIITLVLFIGSFIATNMRAGAGWMGFPLIFSSWNTNYPITTPNDFSVINLVLDLIIYYLAAVLISLGISKLKK
jgi:hypothetical protein